MTNFFAISVDGATAEELNNIQEIIKKNANGWWHRQSNLWIAGGHSAKEWRDLIKPYLTETTSNVLVLKLAEKSEAKKWAFFGAESQEKTAWLIRNY